VTVEHFRDQQRRLQAFVERILHQQPTMTVPAGLIMSVAISNRIIIFIPHI